MCYVMTLIMRSRFEKSYSYSISYSYSDLKSHNCFIYTAPQDSSLTALLMMDQSNKEAVYSCVQG